MIKSHSHTPLLPSLRAKQSHAADGGAGRQFERFFARREQNDTEGVKIKQDD